VIFFKSINLSYAINLHAVQFDHEQGHIYPIEHTFMLKCPNISERLYLSGLIGRTVNNRRPAHLLTNPIVAEFQLGMRLVKHLFLTSEYRVNQYRRSDVHNLTVGLQYKMIW
jgi:hypothetical protein